MQMLIKTKHFILICFFTLLTGCSDASLDNTQNKEPPDEPGINEDSSNTIEDLKFRADNGDASAMVELSDEYYEGTKVSEDLEASFKYAKLAADLGDPDGLASLGEFYSFAIFVDQDLGRAFELFEAASLKNSARGQYGFAQLFDYGWGVDVNHEQANYWYRQAIANGHDEDGYYQLAINLLEGRGGPVNREEALKLALEATEVGYLTAHYLIGEIYQYGWGVENDLSQAQKHYKLCSDDGDLDCRFEYARPLTEGTTSKPANVDHAVQIMENLANEEYLPAISTLGLWYDEGSYVSRDDDQAVIWYQRGSELEDPKSIGLLATMYHLGEGVEIDIERAITLYEDAASADDIDSLLKLYELYSEGMLVEGDLTKAENALKAAVELGSVTAMSDLALAYEKRMFGGDNLNQAKLLYEQIIAFDGEFSATAASNLRKMSFSAKSKLDKRDPFSKVDFGEYKALVIGIDAYEKLNPLRTSIQDAQTVTKTLREDYSFEVELLLNPTRESLLNKLIKYRETLTTSDNFLLFYAGHGTLQSETGKGFWQPADSDPTFETNWIAVDTITGLIKTLKARNTMIIADSCYGGAVFRSGITTANSKFMEPSLVKRMLETETRVAMTSGGLEPVVDSVNQGDKNSIFTRALIKALNDEAPVKTGSELFSQVASAVISETSELGFKQTPEYAGLRTAGHEGGDFIFRRAQN